MLTRLMRQLLSFAALGLVGTALGCAPPDDDAEGEAAAAAVSSASTRAVTGDEAVEFYRSIFERTLATYKKQYPGRLGRGWTGNMTGSGDKCDVVHGRFSRLIETEFFAAMKRQRVYAPGYDVVTRTASGALRVEALSGHVYFALVNVSDSPPSDVFVFDPWRDALGFYDRDPNTGTKTDLPWGYSRSRPSK